jgi:hypothetical protein
MLVGETVEDLKRFVEYAKSLEGDEKGEAQVFCDRLFQAFGHEGYREAGAILEPRVRSKGKRTKFADLLWRPRLLLEMKKRGERLERHYSQVFEYWLQLVPQRPSYVVLCNFDEFWIYDFDTQLEDPVDRVALEELPDRYTALNFLFPEEREPQFGNNRVAVTRAAADKIARVFNSTVSRGEDRSVAQRFVLQCVVALFSEDFDLLPRGHFTELVNECRDGASTYDLIGGLFRQMGNPSPARGGRFRGVAYFNGGIFDTVDPVDLTLDEVELLADASSENWGKVQPQIFGTLFQSSMDKAERHAYGAHFTSEADIQKAVLPTIVRPWRERVEDAKTLADMRALRKRLLNFRVLDPACGAGDFLYVAYRELIRIEMDLLAKIHANFGERARAQAGTTSLLSPRQFYGIEINPFGAELARVTMMLGKEQALAETQETISAEQIDLPLDFDTPLPLDNLDANILCDDALFCDWPEADAIIGNPPYMAKNKMQQEYGVAYVNRVRAKYPEVPGRADYCVYWFRRAHDELPPDGRAGLVGTNTIRQNYSREGGLDYIVGNGGTITEAVSTQVWSGEAAVHVSIVNWVKGDQAGKKRLYRQLGDRRDSDFEVVELDRISAALSGGLDVTKARNLRINTNPKVFYQGQTHGHEGFILDPDTAAAMVRASAANSEVLFRYLTADDLLGNEPPAPSRFVIDFHPRDVNAARKYGEPFKRVQELVLPDREEAAAEEARRNEEALAQDPEARVNRHHKNFLNKWWLLSYPREELIQKISILPRYAACGRLTKRPIFEFVDSGVRPSDVVQVFSLSDDYSFGILQSGIHWLWFVERCSTLKGDFRYTSETVFKTFPWPQSPTLAQAEEIAAAAVALRALRRDIMRENDWDFRELYRTLELPGENPLKVAQEALDSAVRAAYGMDPKDDTLTFLLRLNEDLSEKESDGTPIAGPGLPPVVEESQRFITPDCVSVAEQL